MASVQALLALCRPTNAAIAVGGVAVGALMQLRADGVSWTSAHVTHAVAVGAATSLILAAGNAFNDVCDVATDRLNRPDRPIASGRISRRMAGAFAAATGLAGIALAATVSSVALLLAVGAAALLAAYSLWLKSTPFAGNVVVSLLSAGAVLAGGVAVGGGAATFAANVFVLLLTFVREVLKDIEDLPGDLAASLRTTPAVLGPRVPLIAAGAAVVLSAVWAPVPSFAGHVGFGWRYLVPVCLLVEPVAGWAVVATWRRPDAATAGHAQRAVKLCAVVGLVAVAIG